MTAGRVGCSWRPLSPLTAALPLNPFPPFTAVRVGLSPPRALPLPAWPILTSLHTLPSPWEVVPTQAGGRGGGWDGTQRQTAQSRFIRGELQLQGHGQLVATVAS